MALDPELKQWMNKVDDRFDDVEGRLTDMDKRLDRMDNKIEQIFLIEENNQNSIAKLSS